MSDKEVRAIAIKEMTYADMIAIGATEEIAMAASGKARCVFEAAWDCAVEKVCEWLLDRVKHDSIDYPMATEHLINDFCKVMEE